MSAHLTRVPTAGDIRIAIIAPDGREAMLQHAEQFAAARIPFIFDPGQGLPMFDGDELRRFVAQASWVAVNDYEGACCASAPARASSHCRVRICSAVIVTLGAEGCDCGSRASDASCPASRRREVLDPTGCGDAFRAALLYGLERDWPIERCVELGNRVGALKIASRGGQNHTIDRAALGV